MAIAHDAVSSATSGAVTSLTYSHTCTGSDRALFMTCHAADKTFTATYGGQSMTELYDGTPGTPFKHIAAYFLGDGTYPATGANDIVITLSGSNAIASGASSYTGVDVSGTPYDGGAVATGNSTTAAVTITSETGDLVVAGAAMNLDTTQTCLDTERVNVANGDEFLWTGVSDAAGAASVTLDWTVSSNPWTMYGINLNVASGGGATARSNPINGPMFGPMSGPIGI